jgi:hypothetical protein
MGFLSDTSSQVLFFGLVLFFITSIVFVWLYVDTSSKKIAPENCSKVLGVYASIPNVDPSTVKVPNLCTNVPDGTPGTSACSFGSITNLNQATDICNQYDGTTCGAFLYFPQDKLMTFINSGYDIQTSTTQSSIFGDSYLRQNNN